MKIDQLSEIKVIPYATHSGEFNMALDEYLLSLPGTYFRLYGWKSPTLSFGRSNTHLEDIDLRFCQRRGIRGVKRLSGGKTIPHQHEITYSFVSNTSFFSRSILKTYRAISQALAAWLEELGLTPEMERNPKTAPTSSICFKEISAYELTVHRKKIIGSAQFRRRNRFLQHGSILLDIDWELWKGIWRIPANSNQLEQRITSIKDELGTTPAIEEMTRSLSETFTDFFQAKRTPLILSGNDYSEVERLSKGYKRKGSWPLA